MNKNRKTTKIGNDFKQLQTTIFLRTAIILIVAVVIIFIIYNVFFQGHFANAVVGFLNRFIYDDYEAALRKKEQQKISQMQFLYRQELIKQIAD